MSFLPSLTPPVKAFDLIKLPTSPDEIGKRSAARRAIDEYVTSGMSIGVGSGSTIVYGIQRLAERVWGDEGLKIQCVATSFQTRELLRQAGLHVTDLSETPLLDVTIDGADEVEFPSLDCIKGGGGCHTEEKVVAAAAKKFILIVDYRKCSPGALMTVWRKGVPVEVLPFALSPVRLALERMGAKVILRSGAPGKAGPIVTDQGGLILDCDWDGGEGLKRSAKLVDADIQAIPGVVETGFFLGRAHSVFIGNADGTAEERKRID